MDEIRDEHWMDVSEKCYYKENMNDLRRKVYVK